MVSMWRENFLCTRTLNLFFVFLLMCFVSSVCDESFAEKMVLLEFKNSVSDPHGMLSSWQANNSNYCSWFGVSCNSNDRVTEVRITGNSSIAPSCSKNLEFSLHGFGIRRNCYDINGKLVGKLSPVIGNLTELRVLSLPFNDFRGEIPVGIWGLKNLEVIDFEGNLIGGNFSVYDFTCLRKLRILNLGFNRIVGKFPASLARCRALRILNLAGNKINDVIPGFIGGFKQLRGIYLPYNLLIGPVPADFGNHLANLEHLDLSVNFLEGEIPSSLGNCSRLTTLLLSSNALYGIIPPEFGRLRRLEVLDVSRNGLSGPIPAELGKCVNLSVLVLSSHFDQLLSTRNPRGEIVFDVYGSTLDDYNFYEGSIPESITTLPRLKMIWAPGANLEGNFPSNWGKCEALKILNLAQNFFTGNISGLFGGCDDLHFLNISSNRLKGHLDGTLAIPCMTVFDVSRNFISGSFSHFNRSICHHFPSFKPSPLQTFNPSFAYLSFFTYKTQSENLPQFSATSNLIIHNLAQNNFTGAIPLLPIALPRFQEKMEYAFLAGGNKFTGSLGENLFGNCHALDGITINISDNNFDGQILENIGSVCRSLKILDASRNKISVPIPKSIGKLKSLLVLDLSWNKLYGKIPIDIGHIKYLKYLSLEGNRLGGTIPASLGHLHSLEVLKLSSNSFSGEIPQAIVSLRNLTILSLNNNKLSGKIPVGLENMKSLRKCDVSSNNLSWPLMSHNKLINCSGLLGNPSPPSSPAPSASVPPKDQQGSNKSQNYDDSLSGSHSKRGNNGLHSIEFAIIISASVVSVLLAVVALFFYTRRPKPKSRVNISEPSERREITVFNDVGVPLTYEGVVQATGNFSATNCIGNGGFGATYRAEVSAGTIVAVKRLTLERRQGIPQFLAEVTTLGRLRHRNLITLIGYYASEAEMFLIYNYLPGGNLEKFIQERARRGFCWNILHKIALDIACALAYLHDQCNPRVLHRDIKPSNILLDNDFTAYLSDFGLSRLLRTADTHATTGVAGTFGYVAPEYALTCRLSDKADVYSYGVVLLELMANKRALDPSFASHENGFNIVSWACLLLQRGREKDIFATGLWDADPQHKLLEILHLAIMCTTESLSARPTMRLVAEMLKELEPPSVVCRVKPEKNAKKVLNTILEVLETQA